jgi:type I restriction enzyme R subunit
VLDKTISSMTTFKQIVGRGTRIEESQNKYFFTIMDFKKATELFKDPDFDGEVLLEALADEVGRKLGKEVEPFERFEPIDPFDLICHVAFDRPPLSRRERAAQIRKRDVFSKYGEQARAVLNGLLDKYADAGIEDLENIGILTLDPFNRLGTPHELVRAFGGKPAYLKAVHELEQQLYG